MIMQSFDARTLANMEVALERACATLGSVAEKHKARRHIANKIIRCAKSGARTLEALSEAGRVASTKFRPRRDRQSTKQKAKKALAVGDGATNAQSLALMNQARLKSDGTDQVAA